MIGSKTKCWILAAALFLTALWPASAGAAGGSPDSIPEWDVSISGVVTGIARITFNSDGSIDPASFMIVRPTRQIKGSNLPAVVVTGGTSLTGSWSVDPKGRLFGFLSGGSTAAPFDMSFTGKANIGISKSSLSLSAKGSDGAWKMTGAAAPDDGQALDGTSWIAQVLKDTDKFVELFSLRSDICANSPPPPIAGDCVGARIFSTNVYELYGSGPGYLTQGYVLVGGGDRIAFVLKEFPVDKETGVPASDGVVRSVTGKLSGAKTSSMTGSDDDHANVKMSAFEN